ncbi:MAG: hypothetical protein V3S24_00695, partial [Candidatus Tectomicrobia bacterium]
RASLPPFYRLAQHLHVAQSPRNIGCFPICFLIEWKFIATFLSKQRQTYKKGTTLLTSGP